MPATNPSDAVILERARRFANKAMWSVALQHRRLRSTEPEDAEFVFRWWVDLQFFIVALRRLRRAGELARRAASVADFVSKTLTTFDRKLPQLALIRNVGEHIDDYAAGAPGRRYKAIGRGMVQVGAWGGSTSRLAFAKPQR